MTEGKRVNNSKRFEGYFIGLIEHTGKGIGTGAKYELACTGNDITMTHPPLGFAQRIEFNDDNDRRKFSSNFGQFRVSYDANSVHNIFGPLRCVCSAQCSKQCIVLLRLACGVEQCLLQ